MLPAVSPGGWVLHVNKCLRDVSADKEAMQSSGQSGNSGSDEERKAVIQEDLSDSTPAENAHQDSHHQNVQDYSELPCLFHSYLARCANGQHCRFSHSIHADQVRVPAVKTHRGTARNRIKKRVAKHLHAANLYEVQDILQGEARRDSAAKEMISIWELISVTRDAGDQLGKS